MFVPVGCTQCGKLFQVPQENLGQPAPCPWCGAMVAAWPLSPVSGVATGGMTSGAPVGGTLSAAAATSGASEEAVTPAATTPGVTLPTEPLSLDEEPCPEVSSSPSRWREQTAPTSARRVFQLLAGSVGVVLVAGITLVVLNYGHGRLPETGWAEFTAPDGSFQVLLPGVPVAEEVAANPAGSIQAGQRFVVRGWYSRTAVWVAYHDLEPRVAQQIAGDRDRVLAAGIIRAERDRELTRWEGTIHKEAEVRTAVAWGIEMHIDTPRSTVIEQFLVVSDGSQPRLYVLGVQGKNLTPDSAASRKLFTSFRLHRERKTVGKPESATFWGLKLTVRE